MEHFFNIYKDLEGKPVETRGWEDLEATHAAIQRSIERYDEKLSEEDGLSLEVAGD